MRKFNKFYLEDFYNRLIILFFIFIILFNIIAILNNKNILDTVVNFVSLIFVFPFLFFLKIKKHTIYSKNNNQNNLRKKVFAGPLSYKNIDDKNIDKYMSENNDVLIKRKKHRSDIKKQIECLFDIKTDKLKCMILTGDSGSGKSFLISFLRSDLEKDGYDVCVVRNEYNSLYFQLDGIGKKVIFLDHFEKALDTTDYVDKLKSYSDTNDCVYIFSFPQNFLSQVQNFLKTFFDNIIQEIYILTLNKDDINDYINKISTFTNNSPEKIKQYIKEEGCIFNKKKDFVVKTLCDELVNICKGNAPLIELELLGDILSYNVSPINEKNVKYSFIDSYIDKWVDSFKHKEIAYTLLYFLSDSKSRDIEDIKLATFEHSKYFSCYEHLSDKNGEIITALTDNPLIYHYNDGNVLKFEPVHDYVAEKIRKYCDNKDIADGTISYISFFKKIIEENNVKIYNKIQSNYIKFQKNSIVIKIALFLMFAFVLLINIYNFNADNSLHYQFIGNTIAGLPAIYYIYNYCNKFLKIANYNVSIIPCICGSIIFTLSYAIKDIWGIIMGSEVVILAMCILAGLVKDKGLVAKEKFKKDFYIFGSIGIIIMALGVIFYYVFRGTVEFKSSIFKMVLMYSYYVEFALYSLMSNINHINYKYIMSRVGLSNIFDDKKY